MTRQRLFKPGDRVTVCTTEEMGNKHPAWANDRHAGATGTILDWDETWQSWHVDMDDSVGPARWAEQYLKPAGTIEDIEHFLAS